MDRIRVVAHAQGYLSALAEGKNPLTDQPVGEQDVVRKPRISKCFGYVAGYLKRCIEENGVGETSLYAFKIPEIKNEEAALAAARIFFEKLSSGIDPLDGSQIGSDSVVRKERISRCLAFTAEALANAKVEKNRFAITDEQLESFEYSDTPIRISDIKTRVDALVDTELMSGVSSGWLTDYLVGIQLLEVKADGKTTYKIPTMMGKQLGIIEDSYTQNGFKKTNLLYSRKMQELIVKNIPSIIEKHRIARAEKETDNG